MSDEVEFGLAMPFVVCQSKGGPYDDAAYVAGFEAGFLYAALANQEIMRRQGLKLSTIGGLHGLPFHTANRDQIDLIAMRYGWVVEFSETGQDEWVYATFRKAER